MKKLILVLSSLAMVACATGYNPSYRFDQIQVVNLSGSSIQNVSARVVDSDKEVNCDEVANNAICNDKFGNRKYPQQGIQLSWIDPEGNQKSELLTPNVPITYVKPTAVRIILEINKDESVKAFFEQDSPVAR